MRNKTFVNDTVLQKHIRAIHENFWPFICSFLNCNKKFRTGYRLYVHELSHKGIKPFTCGICRKTFTEKCTLKVHLISHSDLTRFHCELCEYRCKSDSHLREHYKYKHNEFKYYKCGLCDKKYMLKSELKFHMKEHKNNSDTECTLNNSIKASETNENNFCIVKEISFGVFVIY